MDLDAKELKKFVDGQPQYRNELDPFYESMRKLPAYDYSRFYSVYSEYSNIITQGDGLIGLKFIHLPDTEISLGRGMIFSNTCDIDLNNQRKFASRMVYAPIIKLNSYKEMLENATNDAGVRMFVDTAIYDHISDIKAQKISQIFYLPAASNYLDFESIVFFDQICSIDNESVSRDNLSTDRMFCLSSYGWYIFLARLSHFFTKLSDESVQLRFKPEI